MHQPRQVPGPSLELIFETIHGFQRTGALKAALELDVFTGITDGAHTAITLARRAEASERGMRILCDYLAVLGLLTKTADRYELTSDSQAFLNQRSPAYVGTAIDFLLSPPQVNPFQDVASAVRNDGAVTGQGVIAPEHPVWVRAKSLGIRSVPAVVIDGTLAACCAGRGPDEATLRAAGLGQPIW
jgi:hypothetical protein